MTQLGELELSTADGEYLGLGIFFGEQMSVLYMRWKLI